MKAKNIVIIMLVLGGLMSCAPKTTTVDLRAVEKLRVYYNRGKIQKLDDLIAIYQDQAQPIETRIAAVNALAEIRHRLSILNSQFYIYPANTKVSYFIPKITWQEFD